MIDYRALYTVEELKQVEQLEIVVWGLNPIDAVPMYVMHAAALNGGLVLGAFDNERMIGMAYCFAAKRGSDVYLWSHMTGVHPDYQGSGIGYELKQTQRRWGLENGYQVIRWTYDPLIRGNAHFNIALLGTTANVYHENFYGDMDDDINRGLPSDRTEAEWQLDSPRGKSFEGTLPPSLIQTDGLAQVKLNDLGAHDSYFVPLPRTLTLEREQRYAWRMSVRSALQAAFGRGYVITGFAREACGYVVERQH
jgi:predicted GNAT superfamily acetyltransferase